MANLVSRIKQFISRRRELKKLPLSLEFIVASHCNLNCKGCTHYSPLASNEMPSLESLEEDMRKISEVCPTGIDRVSLVGGETLLYPDLCAAMNLLIRYFPNVEKRIYTNGLLIPKLKDDFWTAAKAGNYIIEITRYPVNVDYDKIDKICSDHGIRTQIYGDRGQKGSFFKFALDPEGKQNARLSHFKCYNRGCITVTDGKIFPCATSAFSGLLNDKSDNVTFIHNSKDFIIVDRLKNINEIKRLRDKPVPFCRYCINPPQTVDYAISKRDINEWID